ncbi:hypothetical protein OIV83_002353 [Microbotryomycetes sp. JL201]|nr:hypothetical protein OIV83_002353 [Microbotryomycetes sp. JL201]
MNATLRLSVLTLTQCKNATITWASSRVADEDKMIQVFVKGSKSFAERITGPSLSGDLGSFIWTCDFPAGSWIALQFNNRNGSLYNTQGFYEVQPGETDSCLRTNPGQLAEASMASVAASLSSASPQLFTYASTQSRTSSREPSLQGFPQTATSRVTQTDPTPTASATNTSSDSSNQTAIIAATTLSAFGGGGGSIASWVHRIPFGNGPSTSMPNVSNPLAPPPTTITGSVDERDGHSTTYSIGPRAGMGEIQEESSSNGHSGEGLAWSAAPFANRMTYSAVPANETRIVPHLPPADPMYGSGTVVLEPRFTANGDRGAHFPPGSPFQSGPTSFYAAYHGNL